MLLDLVFLLILLTQPSGRLLLLILWYFLHPSMALFDGGLYFYTLAY